MESEESSNCADVCLRGSNIVHVHANQINSNIQLNTLYAAEKAEAKRETARTSHFGSGHSTAPSKPSRLDRCKKTMGPAHLRKQSEDHGGKT
jgi:hypothetical protein